MYKEDVTRMCLKYTDTRLDSIFVEEKVSLPEIEAALRENKAYKHPIEFCILTQLYKMQGYYMRRNFIKELKELKKELKGIPESTLKYSLQYDNLGERIRTN